MSEKTRNLIQSIRNRLSKTRVRVTRNAILSGLIFSFIVAASLWFFAVSLEAGLWLAPLYRSAILGVVCIGIAGVLIHQLGMPVALHMGWIGGFDEMNIARTVGREYPEIQDRLVNMIQLSDGAHSDAPDAYVDRAARSLGETIFPITFENVARTDRIRRYGLWAIIPAVALSIFIGASPSTFSDASRRMLSPAESFTPPAAFSFFVRPGNTEIIRGDSVEVRVSVRGDQIPGKVDIEYSFEGEIRVTQRGMVSGENKLFSHRFLDIRNTLSYRVISRGVESDWFHIRVTGRPVIQRLDVELVFPEYTHLSRQQLEPNIGDVVAIAGTEVSIELTLGGADVDTAALLFSDGTRIPLRVSGTVATAHFTVTQSLTYSVELTSSDGISNDDAITYHIESIPDASPSISFSAPEPHSEITEEAAVSMAVRMSDDFGFSSLRLYYRVAESRFGSSDSIFSNIRLPLTAPDLLEQETVYDWFISESTALDPVPGDIIEYFVRVWDNDRIGGPKWASTEIFSLRFPSLAEQYQSLDRAEDTAQETLERLLDEAQNVREQFENLRDELRRKPESDFQDERRLEQLRSRQDEMESAVDELSEQIENITDQMSENDLVTEETLDLFRELQQVVDEINSPELMEALRELEQSMESMNLSEMQKNLDEFEFNEDLYNKRLQRALDLFKQMRVQQDLEEAARRAEDLAELEDKLAEETAQLENEKKAADRRMDGQKREEEQQESSGDNLQKQSDRLAEEQEQAAADMKALEEKLEEIQKRMEDLKNSPAESMQDLAEDTQDQELPKKMQQNADQLREQELKQAQQGQQQMQQQLSQLQSDLGQMQQNMQGQQMQLNIQGLRQALEDVLLLSGRQELLRLSVANLSSESPMLREAAREQVQLAEGLTTVADSLQQLSRKIPQMSRDIQQHTGNALREMGSSKTALSERASQRSTGHQKSAMTHLNELALLLSDVLNQMMNGSASGSSNMSMQQMMEQLQNLGQQQQQLNQQIQQLLNDAQGNRLTTDMLERMRQLGGEQEQIRRDLKQLSRNRMARNKILGDLNRIAEEMQESIEELQQNRTSRRTIQRQQQILTRLLQASRSMQEKGKDKKREGRTGKEFDRISPSELSPSEQIEKLRRDLFRALDSGYAPDFEQLIHTYFELLQAAPEIK